MPPGTLFEFRWLNPALETSGYCQWSLGHLWRFS